MGIPKLDRHKVCLRCKARVEPGDSSLGQCSKPDCDMLQQYDRCQEQISAKLLFSHGGHNKIISLFASTKLLLDMAGVVNNHEIIVKYNNVITSFNY